MRTFAVLLAVLVALLPPCVACTLCQVEGGPCSPTLDACCEDESPVGCAAVPGEADGMSDDGSNPCTCGDDCDDRDPAIAGSPVPLSEIAPPPAPAGIVPEPAHAGTASSASRAADARAGPACRLPLRI